MRPYTLDLVERTIVAGAEKYTVAVFSGRGRYAIEEFQDREAAISRARALQTQGERPLVYAVKGTGQALIWTATIEQENSQMSETYHSIVHVDGDTVYILKIPRQGVSEEAHRQRTEEHFAELQKKYQQGKTVLVSKMEDLEAFGTTQLLTVRNYIKGGKPTKQFHTRADGLKTVYGLLTATQKELHAAEAEQAKATTPAPAVAETKAETAEQPAASEENDNMATATKKKATKTAKKTAVKKTTAPGGRRSAYAEDAKITLLVKENPKREGTAGYKNFAKYKNGMKVADFLKAGGTRADIAWDVKKAFISIK